MDVYKCKMPEDLNRIPGLRVAKLKKESRILSIHSMLGYALAEKFSIWSYYSEGWSEKNQFFLHLSDSDITTIYLNDQL